MARIAVSDADLAQEFARCGLPGTLEAALANPLVRQCLVLGVQSRHVAPPAAKVARPSSPSLLRFHTRMRDTQRLAANDKD